MIGSISQEFLKTEIRTLGAFTQAGLTSGVRNNLTKGDLPK